MIWNFFHLVLLFWFVEISDQSRFILKLKLFDYHNLQKENETYRKFYGCHLRFGICLSSSSDKKCDILQKETRSFRNIDKIDEVFNDKIGLFNLTKTFLINVTVVKENNQNQSWTNQMFINIKDPMIDSFSMGFLTTEKKYKENQRLQYKFLTLCDKSYYGAKCEKICDKTPSKLCLLNNCKRDCAYGQCKWDNIKNNATCICGTGWQGKDCSIKLEICKRSMCNFTRPVCQNDLCHCQNVTDGQRIYCLRDKDVNLNRLVKDPHKNKNTDYIYILTVITVIFGVVGLLGFISITVSRFCIERRSKKLSTVFYNNSNGDIISINTIDSDHGDPE